MGTIWPFDDAFDPPAPVVNVEVARPGGGTGSREIRMLVDTGADVSVVSSAIARELGLQTVRRVAFRGAAGGEQLGTLVAGLLRIGTWERAFELLVLPDESILGRDVLMHWILTLDGPERVARLASTAPRQGPSGSPRQRSKPRRRS